MAMTRKDYKAVAKAVYLSLMTQTEREDVTRRLIAEFTSLNPRFDRVKFWKACMYGDLRDPEPST